MTKTVFLLLTSFCALIPASVLAHDCGSSLESVSAASIANLIVGSVRVESHSADWTPAYIETLMDQLRSNEGSRGAGLMQSGDQGMRLMYSMPHFKPYRSLLDVTDWQGYHHVFKDGASGYNVFWGEPKNLPGSVFMRLAFYQRPDYPRIEYSLVLGPLASGDLNQVLLKVRAHTKASDVTTWVNPEDGKRYLIMRAIPLGFESEDLLRRLIYRLQDLRWE